MRLQILSDLHVDVVGGFVPRLADGVVTLDGGWARDDRSPLARAVLRGDPLHVHALGTALARQLRGA